MSPAGLAALLVICAALLSAAYNTIIKSGEDRLGVVVRVGDFACEAAGGSDGYILTLRTEDGFEASYAIGRETLSGLSALLEGEKTSLDGAPVVPN
mgnify:CR=1 FL=1